MNTTEYIRHRGWNEKGIEEKFFSSSKGIPVTARFMMEAYADYKVEQALRIHDVVGQSELLLAFSEFVKKHNEVAETINEYDVKEFLSQQ